MKRRNHLLLFAILFLALINLSPGKQSTMITSDQSISLEPVILPNQQSVQESGHIRVMVQMDEEEFSYLYQMTNAFMKQYSGIAVELENLSLQEEPSSIMKKFELGESADVLLLENDWIRKYAVSGHLLPAERYYVGSLTGEMLSQVLAQNEWNGYMWGVPFDIDPYVFAYNAKSLSKLGLERPPTIAKEWDMLLSHLVDQGEQAVLLAADFADPYVSMSLLWQFGANASDRNASIFELTDAMKQAIGRLNRLRPHLYRGNDDAPLKWPDVVRQMNEGTIPLSFVRVSEARKGHFSGMQMMMPEPGPSGKSVWNNGRSFVVSANTQYSKAAGIWIAEMTSAAQQRDWQNITGHLPVLKSLYFDMEKNHLPVWLPASLVHGKADTLPISSMLPQQMTMFSSKTLQFVASDMNMMQYIEDLSHIQMSGK